MGSNDFYDDDLIRERDRPTRIKMGPGDEPALKASHKSDGEGIGRPVSELNLTRMARHKQEADTQTAQKLQELEILRKRQEQLEQEKRQLEEFQRKSEEFDRGKRELVANIKRSVAAIERDDLDAQRYLELLESSRGKYKSLLSDLEGIKEQEWTEESIREELARALAVIEDVRIEFNKQQTKVDAARTERAPAAPAGGPGTGPILFDDTPATLDPEHSLGHWLRMGVGLTLPLIATFVILFIIYIFLAMMGYF